MQVTKQKCDLETEFEAQGPLIREILGLFSMMTQIALETRVKGQRHLE